MGRVAKRVKLESKEFETILVFAVRYCLSKQPLISAYVINSVREWLPDLNYQTVKYMWNDVRVASDFYSADDERMWMEFCKELCTELDRRDSDE